MTNTIKLSTSYVTEYNHTIALPDGKQESDIDGYSVLNSELQLFFKDGSKLHIVLNEPAIVPRRLLCPVEVDMIGRNGRSIIADEDHESAGPRF